MNRIWHCLLIIDDGDSEMRNAKKVSSTQESGETSKDEWFCETYMRHFDRKIKQATFARDNPSKRR